jgi:hypothetical protein
MLEKKLLVYLKQPSYNFNQKGKFAFANFPKVSRLYILKSNQFTLVVIDHFTDKIHVG